MALTPAFDECQLPPDISFGMTSGPEYKTVVTQVASGAEQRISLWPRGRVRCDLTKAMQQYSKRDVLLAFYRARGGRARGFRFKDWNDYTVTTAQGLIDNSAGGTTLQLQKTYTDGVNSEIRPIKKPVAGSVVLYKDGAVNNAFTVDTTTGLVTLSAAAPSSVFTWAGQFDTPVRFDTDLMKMTADDLYSSWQVSVLEVMI